MKTKLTKKVVEETEPAGADLFVWDTEMPGFGVKVTPKGKRIYVCQYRVMGRTRRVTLGRHGKAVTIEKARGKAKEYLGQAALGEDPAAEKLDARHGPTVADLADRYLAEHAAEKKKASSLREDTRLINAIVKPKLGSEKALAVERKKISDLHHELRETPYQANRVLALLKKVFNLAERWGLRPDGSNPCRHVEKFPEQKRRRFLSADELGRLGAALSDAERDNTEDPMAIAAIRLLIFTGARLSEILTLTWKMVNVGIGALVLPDSKTGFKTIQLTAPARAVLEALPVIEGNPYVLPGRRRGSHLVGIQHIWERIAAAAKLEDLRLHDLRHSYASIGAAAGLGLPVIGALLGHTEASTTWRYAHLAADPLKAAAEVISGKIEEAMKAEPKKLHVVK